MAQAEVQMTIDWFPKKAWFPRKQFWVSEPGKWLLVCVIVGILSFLMGMTTAWTGSKAHAAQDCRWYSAFEHEGVMYPCYPLGKTKQ
jgi:hypothetical protein